MVFKEFSLEGKVAIVTGAGRGIGKAIALVLAEAGSDIVAAARTREQLEETAREVQKLGQKCLTIPTDVTKSSQVDKMVEQTVSEFGKIDILVNSAGVLITKPLIPLEGFRSHMSQILPNFDTPTSEEEWHKQIDTNLTSVFLCCKAAGRYMMKQRRGKIINISAVGAARGAVYQAPYDASKAAVSMFTRALALEWGRYNINVNAIGPGMFRTPLSEWQHANEEIREQLLRTIPLRRVGETRELGLLAVYLASDASNYVTGQSIYVDGGYLA